MCHTLISACHACSASAPCIKIIAVTQEGEKTSLRNKRESVRQTDYRFLKVFGLNPPPGRRDHARSSSVISADVVGRMLLVDPTPAPAAASRSRELAAAGKLQPSVGENTADVAATAVGIDLVSQSGENTLAAPLAVTTFSHNVWLDFLFFFFFKYLHM